LAGLNEPSPVPRRPLLALGLAYLFLWWALDKSISFRPNGEWGLAVAAVVIALALIIEWTLYKSRPKEAWLQLGLGRPRTEGLVRSAVASGCVLAFFPLFSATTGFELKLRPGWPLLAVALFAQHGIAEELLFRGFLFGHLRQGRSFWRAVAISLPFIALTHVKIIAEMGAAIGIAATAVSIATAIPFSFLYERGGKTIWAPALLHFAIDTFKLFQLPAGDTTLFSLSLAAVSLTLPYLVFLFPKWQGEKHPRRRNEDVKAN
jgi:membrane protease YdiL (CAAX protease family)